jgi:YVTN family beta-propeller protein
MGSPASSPLAAIYLPSPMSHRMNLPRRLFLALALGALAVAALTPRAEARNAYVASLNSDSVSVIDTATNTASPATMHVGRDPFAIAITPDGKFAYLADRASNQVSVINTQTNEVMGVPDGNAIAGIVSPSAIAITPDGKTAYVANSDGVSVVNIHTNQVVGSPIPVGNRPDAIAITPDGKTAYVANSLGSPGTVSVIDTATNTASPTTIPVGAHPIAIAITPDGKTVYVANEGSNNVSVIDTATNTASPTTIPVGAHPNAIAITPDGKTAYVAGGINTVSVINTQTNQVVGSPITVGDFPAAIAITSDGKTAYVANGSSNTVSVINTQTNQVVGSPITVGGFPGAIAIIPNQPPTASFTTAQARPGVPLAFDASASHDFDGQIANYDWDFGDGQSSPIDGPITTHTYTAPGTYRATLTLTDNEGCSTADTILFTGQTAFCGGSALATAAKTEALASETIRVAFPKIRVRCPRRAKPRGCKFRLQAVSPSHKGSAESEVVTTKLRAGRSGDVALKPTPAFTEALSSARSVLIREALTIKGSTRVRFRNSAIVG